MMVDLSAGMMDVMMVVMMAVMMVD
jgi:hypothetical protein